MQTPQDRSGALDRGRGQAAGRPKLRLGVVLWAIAAALVSVGLVYWITAGGDRTLSEDKLSQPPTRRAYAPARPDAGQVERAYEQLQETYADQGSSGVVNFARACVETLRTDPGVLDFCLAFDIYAAALSPDEAAASAWQAEAGARDLALARSVLPPGQDAVARLAQVRELARRTSLEAPPPAEVGTPAQPPPPTSVPTAAPPQPAIHPAAKAKSKQTSTAAAACRKRATAAQRTVCESPALREADRRLRLAYRRALRAGVSPHRLAQDQARFRAAVNAAAPNRAAVARLYHRRTRNLEILARNGRAHGG